MNQGQLEKLLADSFADRKLDNDEKFELRNIASECKPDELRFLRNAAFRVLRDQIRAETSYSADEANRDIKWLERVVKTLDTANVASETSAYFSPGEECRRQIIACIQQATQRIDVCVFTISDNKISAELLRAHQRGIAVRILTDNHKSEDKGSDVMALSKAGVPVVMDNSHNHMHHKFAIFDGNKLLNGSFNWTRSATMYNQEDITITDDPDCVAKFQAQFERLWKAFCQSSDQNSYSTGHYSS